MKEKFQNRNEKWKIIKSKKNSVSSLFLNRTYTIYKYALNSIRMTAILVSFYNMLLKEGYYLNRWMNIVDATLEKGKGPVLGKLRTITLIEGDLQILMRIFLFSYEQELIEEDNRFAKANYRLQKNYSIETAILEK